MKGFYIVLSGSKKNIEENEKKIQDFLKTFKRKVGGNEVSCAKISYGVPIDNEHTTGDSFKLGDFPKIEWYLKAYKAVILKYSHHGKTGRVYVRGRSWKMENIDKKNLVEQGLERFAQDKSFQQLFEWLLEEQNRFWIRHIDEIRRKICNEAAFTRHEKFVDQDIIPLVKPMIKLNGEKHESVQEEI